ncbi:MAG: Lrp/AsnC ligand binding domain-containing protein [Saprospiraceae bacterium]|nr:Lrp/AsnC ligand binding domain-containing protein [Saprospiraceae bacterium]
MAEKFHIDSLDKRILSYLTKNARMPFIEVARLCNVSGAAVHQRVQKLTEAGIISGSRFTVDYRAMGYLTCAFIGIHVNLIASHTHNEVFEKINKIPEIIECHHVTGNYSLLLKIYAKTNEHLKKILVEKIQSIEEVTNTETIISLEEGFIRQLPVDVE